MRKLKPLTIYIGALVLTLAVFLFVTKTSRAFLHNDNLAIVYPLRVLVSTAFNNGVFPFWDHWIHGGTPLNTLFISYPSSPIVRALSFFGVYREGTFTVEILLMLIIGLSGIFFWIREFCSPLVGLFAAVSYVLSPYILYHAPVNIEAVVGPCLYPWLAFGMRRALMCDLKGSSIMALAAWVMTTTGYLGTNVIAIQFILGFCLAEYALSYKKSRKSRALLLRGLLYLSAGGVLAFCLLSFPIFESYSYLKLNFSQVRSGAFNPFVASTRLDSLVTLFFPNHLSPFSPDKFEGHIAPLYFGVIGAFFLFFALAGKSQLKLKAVLVFFIVLSFVPMLSQKYALSGFFMSLVPYLKQVRFHSWNIILTVFFALTLACIGMKEYFEKPKNLKRLGIAGGVFGACAIVSWIFSRNINGLGPKLPFYTYSQVYVFLIFAGLLYGAYKARSIKKSNKLILSFIALSLVSAAFMRTELEPHSGAKPTYIAENEARKQNTFVVPENTRGTHHHLRNEQYFDKKPVISGYQPFMLPAAKAIFDRGEQSEHFKEIFSGAGIRVEFLEFNPEKIKVTVFSERNQTLVWSSPHTPHWKLFVNGHPAETKKTTAGLSSFNLEQGKSLIELEYKPAYWYYSVALQLLALVLIGCQILNYFFVLNARREPQDPRQSWFKIK